MNKVISVENLTKEYFLGGNGTRKMSTFLFPKWFREEKNMYKALDDVSFDVREGECFGIMGVNGAGKSTLLQIISGVLKSTSGTVTTTGDISALLELGAGFNPELSGIENIRLTGTLKGMTESQINNVLDSVIEFADIGDFIDKPVKIYSSGMFMRVAFSANLMNQPKILIVDEALAVGDQNFQKKCIQRFYDLRNAGTTVLFVSHDNYQVRHICERALLLNKGKVAAYGASDFVASEYDVMLENLGKDADGVVAQNSNVGDRIVIAQVHLEDAEGNIKEEFNHGEELTIVARVRIQNTAEYSRLTFVTNLYKHDDFYVCGTTTLMDGLEPFATSNEMEVRMKIPKLNILAGRYKWRFAVNEENGLGILTERTPICEFTIKDNFEAVGLVNLQREWVVKGV